jgi:hypothetical protein
MNDTFRRRLPGRHMLWWWLLVPAATLQAAAWAGRPLDAGRPEAPVDVRWLEVGQDGRVSVEVTPAIDYDRLELRLLIPGLDGPPTSLELSGGAGGRVRRATWLLAAPLPVSPRLLVILETRGQRLGRTVAAPHGTGQATPPRAVPVPVPREHGSIDGRGTERRPDRPDLPDPLSVTDPRQHTARAAAGAAVYNSARF